MLMALIGWFMEGLLYGFIAGVIDAYNEKLMFAIAVGIAVVGIVYISFQGGGAKAYADWSALRFVAFALGALFGIESGATIYKDVFSHGNR